MHTPLSLILLDVDDFGHWNSRLGNDACDDLLCQVARRLGQLLRSYDLLGRPGKDEFLALLPGCGAEEARLLAERIRAEVFCRPFRVEDESIRLSACFGIASSSGRSPVVVLRQAETALQWARTSGPESIQSYLDSPHREDAQSPIARRRRATNFWLGNRLIGHQPRFVSLFGNGQHLADEAVFGKSFR